MLILNDKKQSPSANIGAGVVVKGAMKVPGLVVVEGSFEGDISADTLIVGKTGQVTGKATATRVEVMGRMSHQVHAQHLLIHATGSVRGEGSYSVLEVTRGGVIEGKITHAPSHTPGTSADALDASR